jgi:hypothetical protein
MAHAAGDAHPYPIYGAHYRVTFPMLDADGDLVTGATTPDAEVSKDAGTFADCTNESTEIATNSGMYFLDLTGAEMTAKCVAVIAKSATAGMKTTPIVLYPKRLVILESGVAQAGAAGTITLASGAVAIDGYYAGLYVHITDNDAAGSQYQARKIISYVGSTRVATIESNWGTNPSSSSNYDILIPEHVSVANFGSTTVAPTVAGVPEVDVTHWLGTAAATPTVAGVPEVDVTHWIGTAAATPTVAGVPEVDITHISGSAVSTSSAQLGVNVVNAGGTAWASGSLTSGVFASGAITATAIAADAITAAKVADGTIDAATFAAGAITATVIATGAIDADALAADAIDEIWDEAMTEISVVPGVTASIRDAIRWIFVLSRNKITQTATTQLVRNDADAGTIGTSTHSDDGTTHIRGEFA